MQMKILENNVKDFERKSYRYYIRPEMNQRSGSVKKMLKKVRVPMLWGVIIGCFAGVAICAKADYHPLAYIFCAIPLVILIANLYRIMRELRAE